MTADWEDFADWFEDASEKQIHDELMKHPLDAVAWLAAGLIHERNRYQ